MLTFLFFAIWIINIYLSLQKKNIKYISVISFIFLILLFCGNNLNRDYWNYRSMYEIGNLTSYDIGFQFIGNICFKLNFHYNIFLGILIIPCYLIVFYVANKMHTNIHMFYSLYFAFLVFYDINQIRNFVVASLLTLGLYFLLEKRNISFIITMFFATLFHTIALFYIPLVLVNKLAKTRKTFIYLSIYSIVSIFLLKLIVSNSDIIGRIIQLFSNNKEVIIYGTSNINFGFLVPLFYFIFNILLVLTSNNILLKINKLEKNSNLLNICVNTIFLSMMFLPLLVVNLTFDRIFRNFSFLYYILAGVVMNELLMDKKKNKKIIIAFFCFLVLFSVVWAAGTIYRYNGFSQSEYEMILNNNIFF